MSEKTMYGVSLKGMRTALKDALIDLGRSNERVVVLDCETATVTNVLPFKEEFPSRYCTLGIAEQDAVSFAFGVSRSGLIPYLPLFCCFIARRACDQIFIQAGYANANIKMIGCYSGLTTPNTGATHQSINDLAIIRSMPNIRVFEACDEIELRSMVIGAAELEGPVYIRMARGDIPEYEKNYMPVSCSFAPGKAYVLRSGKDVTLAGSGIMVGRCIKAAEMLADEGIDAEVINVSSVKPLDEETLISSAMKTRAFVTAENHSVIGGVGSAVAELLGSEYPVPVKRVGIKDRYGESGPLPDLLIEYGLTARQVCSAAREALQAKRG